jgi:hypothetical protein
MDPGRRTILLAGAALLAAAAGARPTDACSLTGTRTRPFRRGACEDELEELVRILNEAPSMSEEAVEAWYAERQFEVDHDLLWQEEGKTVEVADFLRTYRLSDGKLDSKPIRLVELELVRQRKNRAAFAFVLKRHSYHAADPEGCNGLFAHDEYWGDEQTGYIATFVNNRVERLREFPEWFADT